MTRFECKQQSASGLAQGALRQMPRGDCSLSDARSIRCTNCGTILATEADATSVGGQHAHTFINPQGYIYRIRCFASVRNVRPIGTPSSEFTWFTGHSWLILNCAGCFCHVGWRFDSSSSFYALVADRLAEDASGIN